MTLNPVVLGGKGGDAPEGKYPKTYAQGVFSREQRFTRNMGAQLDRKWAEFRPCAITGLQNLCSGPITKIERPVSAEDLTLARGKIRALISDPLHLPSLLAPIPVKKI